MRVLKYRSYCYRKLVTRFIPTAIFTAKQSSADFLFCIRFYLYNIQTVSVEGVVLLMSATSLLIGSLVLYKNDDLWRHEHEAGMFIYRKKEPAENEQ